MSPFYWVPILLYFAGWLGEFLRNWSAHEERFRWSGGVLAMGWGAHTILLGYLLWNGNIQVATLLNVASWLAIIAYYVLLRRLQGLIIRFVFPPFAIALLITAHYAAERSLFAGERFGLSPTSAGNVLTAHIISVMAGILLFGLACLASIVYLYQEHQIKAKQHGPALARLPSLGSLEKYNHKAIILGFFFLTIGILLGQVVAGVSTLPHRLFSLRQLIPTVMWLVYAVFLLVHDLEGRRGRFGAIWSIVGFVIVVLSLIFEIATLTARV